MSKSSAQIKINLIPKDPFFGTVPGRILKWALSAGRYIVIFTELVVIVSFATRFTLDRQVTDLNESISGKENIINSYGALEKNVRIAQAKIASYTQVKQDNTIVETFADISAITPEGIILDKLVINKDTVIASGNALSQSAFNLLINNLQISPNFQNVSVDTVESNDDDSKSGFTFSIRANTQVVVKKSAVEKEVDTVDVLDRTGGL